MSSHNGAGSYNWLNTAPKDLVLPFQAEVTLLMHLQVAISVSLEPVRKYKPHLTSPSTAPQAIFVHGRPHCDMVIRCSSSELLYNS